MKPYLSLKTRMIWKRAATLLLPHVNVAEVLISSHMTKVPQKEKGPTNVLRPMPTQLMMAVLLPRMKVITLMSAVIILRPGGLENTNDQITQLFRRLKTTHKEVAKTISS